MEGFLLLLLFVSETFGEKTNELSSTSGNMLARYCVVWGKQGSSCKLWPPITTK